MTSPANNDAAHPIDREIVAVHVEGPHEHITRFKIADGTEITAEQAIAEIESHAVHYWAQGQLARVQQCPDCNEKVLWA